MTFKRRKLFRYHNNNTVADNISSGVNNTPLHKHQDDLSLHKYVNVVQRLISMLLKSLAPQSYTIPLPEEVQLILEELHTALSNNHRTQTYLKLCIHNLLMAIWKRQWHPTTDNMTPCPTNRLLILLSLQQDGGHTDPQNMTGYIAKLKYSMRLAFLAEIKQIAKQQYGGHDHLACDEIQAWFTEKHYSPFNTICTLQHMATSITMGTMSMPSIWWKDRKTFRRMLYRGDDIEFSKIQEMFIAMEKETIDLWENKILMGLTHLRIPYTEAIHEDLSNTTTGYCFLNDSRNTAFVEARTIFFKAIWSNKALKAQFVRILDTGDVQWNILALREWLSNYAQFSKLLLLRCEMLGGGPGRGTELTNMSYRSTQTRRRRNLSVLDNHLAIIRTYHKLGALSGKDKLIPHSLDAVTSDLMIQDLALVRPFAEWVAMKCFDNVEVQQLYQYKLFVNIDKLFTTNDMSNAMKQYTINHIGTALTINPWRHIAIAFRRKLCIKATKFFDEETETNDTVAVLQLGHSRQVENMRYGVTSDTLDGSSEDVLPLYLDASTHWQVECKVVPGMCSYDKFTLFLY